MAEPNEKQELLDKGGYEVHSRELTRKVFPRIIRESNEVNTGRIKPQIRDVVAFYYLLLDYVNGQEYHEDGTTRNEFFGACWLSYEQIMEHIGIDRSRIKKLAGILEANGLVRTKKIVKSLKHYVLYYPSFAPNVSDDGYVVDENGEKVVPSSDVYLPKSRKTSKNV